MADLTAALQQITNELDRLNNSVVDCLRDIPIAIANTARAHGSILGMKVGVLADSGGRPPDDLCFFPASYEVLRVEQDGDGGYTYFVVIDEAGRFRWLGNKEVYPRFTAQGVELDTPVISEERGKSREP